MSKITPEQQPPEINPQYHLNTYDLPFEYIEYRLLTAYNGTYTKERELDKLTTPETSGKAMYVQLQEITMRYRNKIDEKHKNLIRESVIRTPALKRWIREEQLFIRFNKYDVHGKPGKLSIARTYKTGIPKQIKISYFEIEKNILRVLDETFTEEKPLRDLLTELLFSLKDISRVSTHQDLQSYVEAKAHYLMDLDYDDIKNHYDQEYEKKRASLLRSFK